MNNSTQVTFARNPHTHTWRGFGCWRRWLAASLTLGLATVLSSVRAQSGQPAVVGEWLNGSASLADVSGYSPAGTHDGYAVGAGNYVFTNDVPPGKTGQSLFLYTNDTAIAISNSSTLDANYTNTFDDAIHSAMTVVFWAKGFPGAWNPWVSKYGETFPSPSGGWQMRINNAGPFACWTIRGTGGIDDMTSSVGSNDGKWHSYVGTYDSQTGIRKLYVDGGLTAEDSGNGAYNLAPAEHLVIGGRDSSPGNSFGQYYRGLIYDVRIYNYALNIGGCGIPLSILFATTNVLSGQTVQLNAPAGTVSYGWASNGIPILGATTNSLTVTNVTVSATYICYATNQCDESYPIAIFTVNVVPSPTFSGNPVLNGSQFEITWNAGTLLQATNAAGPWTPVAGATSPYTNLINTEAPNMFYKLSNP